MTLKQRACENITGKGENAASQHFLLFPKCILYYHRQKSSFSNITLIDVYVQYYFNCIYNVYIVGKEEIARDKQFLLFPYRHLE